MKAILQELREHLQKNRELAYCRLVDTRGSTPQKAGALMLVFPNGSQAGTLGGGCVEAEAKRRALSVLRDGNPEVLQFVLDHDYGWDDGLICGGRMDILVAPVKGLASAGYFQTLSGLVEQGNGGTEVIAFADKQQPASFCFDAESNLVARHPTHSEQHDALLHQIKDNLEPLRDRPGPRTIGQVAYLPLLSRCPLVIIGGGHIGKAVADLAVDLDFDITVVDDREQYVSIERFPIVKRRIHGPMDEVLSNLEVTPDTYCLIVTRGHNHDQNALSQLVQRGARYVGLIGSKRKIKLIFEDLVAAGIPPTALEKVFAPVGINIGSQSVPEIAISIVAELVAHRNLQGQVPGRPTAVQCGAAR